MQNDSTIAYQGEPGAYSDMAAAQLYPGHTRIGCASFAAALKYPLCIIPVTNSTAGPVTTALELLNKSRSHRVIATHWQSIQHALLGLPGARLGDIRRVHSHWQALRQCLHTLERLGLTLIEHDDTAGAARMVAKEKDASHAAVASALAAKVYGLQVLKENVQDEDNNRTLFFILTRSKDDGEPLKDVLKKFSLQH